MKKTNKLDLFKWIELKTVFKADDEDIIFLKVNTQEEVRNMERWLGEAKIANNLKPTFIILTKNVDIEVYKRK